MSLETFVDNVINLAIESCLVYDIPTILSSAKIDSMRHEELNELASESEEVQKQRLYLQDEVRILREGLLRCQKHKTREAPSKFQRSPSAACFMRSDTRD
jgi:hypothetical protein